MVRIEAVLDSWKSVREDTAQAVSDMPESEAGFQPTPDLMTFQETARHILEAGHGLTGLMLEGETDFTGPDFRASLERQAADLPDISTAAGLSAALRDSLERRIAQLAARPPEFFAELITRFDGQRLTRLEMLQFVKEHELTHRAQLFMYLRLKGITPATTRRRQARQAGRR